MSGAPLPSSTAKSLDKRVNVALNKRGARQERWRRLKPLLFLVALVVIGGPLLAALTPYYPNKFFVEYKENAYDPVTKAVNPESVKGLYYLGVFYYYTAREAKAVECWNTIGQWRLGVRLTEWADSPRRQGELIVEAKAKKRKNKENPERELPWKFEHESLFWLGMTYFRMAEKFFDVDARTQPASYLYGRIAAEGLDSPEIGLEDYIVERAKGRGRLLDAEMLGWDPAKKGN